MDNLSKYIEWVELETFFSGYVLVYSIIFLICSRPTIGTGSLSSILLKNLPLAYALTGTAYLGLQLKNWYPDYNPNHMIEDTQLLFLKVFGLISLFFWLPVLFKKPVFSVLHSLVFFFLLIRDTIQHILNKAQDFSSRSNDLKIFTVSIALNIAANLVMLLVLLIIKRFKQKTA